MTGTKLPAGALFVLAALLLPAHELTADPEQVDTHRLAAQLERRGFDPPEQFKALVGVLGTSGTEASWYDYNATSTDREDWWPASTVKLFAAVAALERMQELGFPLRTWLTFHYDAEVEVRLDRLVRLAIGPSNNTAFDALVCVAGFDRINREFFTASNGLPRTVLLRAYGPRMRHPETDVGMLRDTPRITMRWGKRERVIPSREGKGEYNCPDTGNCTTLRELAEAMRRVMLHEALPEQQRFDIESEALELLRETMARERERGQGPVRALREGFGTDELKVYHKPGYAYRWMSDVAFVSDPRSGRRWIVAAAARPGRDALDAGMRHLGAVLADDTLGGSEEERTP